MNGIWSNVSMAKASEVTRQRRILDIRDPQQGVESGVCVEDNGRVHRAATDEVLNRTASGDCYHIDQ